jgi:hypothetical protein
MVEFRDDGESSPWLMEVNGRFWGSTQLAIEAGLDIPRAWAELLEGKPVAPVSEYASGVTLRWLWGDVKRLLTILKGRPPGFPQAYPTRLEGVAELFRRQPEGTRLEAWNRDDPGPAVGEWAQGVSELMDLGVSAVRAMVRSGRPGPTLELGVDRK